MYKTITLLLLITLAAQTSEAAQSFELDGKTYYRISRGKYTSSKKAYDSALRREAKALEKAMSEMNREYDEYLRVNGLPDRYADAEIKHAPEKKGFWRLFFEFLLGQNQPRWEVFNA